MQDENPLLSDIFKKVGSHEEMKQVISSGDVELSGVSKGDLIKVNAVLEGYTLINPTEIPVSGKEQTVI